MAGCQSSALDSRWLKIKKIGDGLKYLAETAENTVRKWAGEEVIRCIRYTMTWECNSKCDSCSIWDIPVDKKEIMSLDELDRFSSDSLLKGVRRIIISGGEPFLMEDLPERMRILHRNCPNAYFGMTCNGLTPARTLRLMKRIYELSPDIDIRNVGLSLNAVDPRIHDRSRGVAGAYEKTIETYRLISGIVPVRFSFLFLPYNIDQWERVQAFANKVGTEAYICWTVNSNRFFDRDFLDGRQIREFYEEIRPVLNRTVKSVTKRYLYNAFINRKRLDCTACRDFFHVDPYGNIYPCNFLLSKERILGNVKEEEFSDIWGKFKREIMIKEIKAGSCMYPNGVCGDSDLNYSVTNSGMHKVLLWNLVDGKI